MATEELDNVLDNMLSKGIPTAPSPDLQRWIHTHRNRQSFKIAQILGDQVSKANSIIPECFGKYHDPTAMECKVCLDRAQCSMKSGNKSTGPVVTAYGIIPANSQSILKVLQGKAGQVARTLSHGTEVILRVEANKLKLLSVDSTNHETGQALEEMDNMATKKGAPATAAKKKAAPVEEEEIDLSLTGADDEGEEETADEVEEGGEEETEEGGEEEAEEEAAPAPKAKKAPKPKAVLNAKQQAFQDHLNGLKSSEDKWKYSAKIAKDLGIKLEKKNDDRIDHMLRCMAIKKALAGTAKAVAKK